MKSCTSIREDGMQNPVVLFEGAILDGRHRTRACAQLGIKPVTTEFTGDERQAAAFVLGNNLHRRQLNSMQKAIVAAHMHLNKDNPVTQADAAARIGISVSTVNLAVRLVNSNNTPLIKRAEMGECTRSEVDEMLFDRKAVTSEKVEALPDTPAEVIDLEEERAARTGTKPKHPERKAKETPESIVCNQFKGLTEKGRVACAQMMWTWLRPALEAAKLIPATAPAEPVVTSPMAKKASRKAKGKDLH
jgi:ParB/RepB/Spo0J family partition protein